MDVGRFSWRFVAFWFGTMLVGSAVSGCAGTGSAASGAGVTEGVTETTVDIEIPAATPSVGVQAPDFTLKTIAGGVVHLADAVSEHPVVLIVLRGWPGYQCGICSAQVDELLTRAADFEKRSVQLVLVYPGPGDGLSAHAREFLSGRTLPPSYRLVLDPDYSFTDAWGLRWNAPRETARPSTFIIESGRRVVFAKTSTTHGGRARPDEILEALPKGGL